MKQPTVTPNQEAPELAKELGIPGLVLKREDLHPYGSHKGRSIPYMMDAKRGEGATRFAISSSGNAALAAIRYIRALPDAPIELTIFIGEHIDPAKRSALETEAASDPRIAIASSPRPLQALMQAIRGAFDTKSGAIVSLRQSTDDTALVGYETLAEELSAIPGLSDVFVPTSSGTTAEAIARYFAAHRIPAKVHAVQTTEVFPIAQELMKKAGTPAKVASAPSDALSNAPSIARAIVDKVAHRRDSATAAIASTSGTGIIARNDDILRAQALLKDLAHTDASPNGALGLAGLLVALKNPSPSLSIRGTAACVITGK